MSHINEGHLLGYRVSTLYFQCTSRLFHALLFHLGNHLKETNLYNLLLFIMTDVLGYAYGLTVFTGGAIGYLKGISNA